MKSSLLTSFTKIIKVEIAVLNFIASISSVTFFIVFSTSNSVYVLFFCTLYCKFQTRSKNLRGPIMFSVFQDTAWSKGPMNISYIRTVSAPYVFTKSSGLTPLPFDFENLVPSSASISPCEVRFMYGSLVGTSFKSYKNLCQKREYKRCKVVCSIPPLYQSTGVQYSRFFRDANSFLFFGSV